MLRRIPRMLRHAVVVAVLLAVSASVYQSWASGAPGTSGWQQTQWGPLGPADRDLLTKVRLAGLWEGPTGQQAQQMASSAEVRDVGRKLAEEHAQLDEEVRSVADQLGVMLPSGPTATQIAWQNEISSQTGSDYDRVFVQLVREAHGQVLPVISEVRSGTQNDLVRQFAETADEFVTRHHQYLESTGLVDYAALPHPGLGLLDGGTEMADLVVPFLVFVAALLAAIALFRAMRSKKPVPGRSERVTVPQPSMSQAAMSQAAMSRPARFLPELTPVAAIPGPRSAGLDTTGPIPVISDVTMHPTIDGSSYRWAPDAVTNSGPQSAVTVNDTRTAVADTGSHRGVPDTGSHRAVSDSGSNRAMNETSSQYAVTDTGSHRAVSPSGSHRMPRSRRARHSTRR